MNVREQQIDQLQEKLNLAEARIAELENQLAERSELHKIMGQEMGPEYTVNKEVETHVAPSLPVGQMLLPKHEDENEMQYYLKAMHKIGIELVEIDSLDEFYRKVIESGLTRLGFERLGLWRFDQVTGLVSGTYGTDTNGNVWAEHHLQFYLGPEGSMYESLISRDRFYVMENTPLVHDRKSLNVFSWTATVALWHGDQNLGWICADNLLSLTPATQSRLELLVQYGALIASILGHKLAQKALEQKHRDELELQGYLKALHSLSVGLARSETLDSFYEQTVKLGSTYLGFEEMRLLLHDQASGEVVGTYRASLTNSTCVVSDESQVRFSQQELRGVFLESIEKNGHEESVGLDQPHRTTTVYEASDTLIAPLGNDNLMGWLCVRQDVQRKHFTIQQVNILTLYAVTVGSLLVRKQIEAKLAATSQRLELATLSAGIGVWEFELGIQRFTADERVYEMYGLTKSHDGSPEKIDTLIRLIHPDDVIVFQQSASKVIVEGAPFEFELRIIRPDGELRFIKVNGLVLSDKHGKAERLIGINWDTTKVYQSEEILRQALEKEKEVGELKSRFVYTASHEFRTPLTSILAVTETLLAYQNRLSESQIEQRLNKIREQVTHLNSILEDVLQLTRLQAQRFALKPVWFDINALCCSILDSFKQNVELARQIHYVCDPSLGEVHLDKRLMHQVINNLLSNAIKYSSSNSVIEIVLKKSNSTLFFQVSDQGIGIPESDLAHLFEPFYRAANVGAISGTGLGLIITKESVELLGGTMQIKSQVLAGTTVTVTIPLLSSEAPNQNLLQSFAVQ